MVPFVAKLGVAAIINKVLFVHGGIASFIKTKKDLANLENEHYLLWNDPSRAPGEHRNQARSDWAIKFGKDITNEVLDSMRLRLLVRSHEPGKAKDGPHLEHGNRLMTINSSSMYGNPFMLRLDTVNLEYSRIWL